MRLPTQGWIPSFRYYCQILWARCKRFRRSKYYFLGRAKGYRL